MEEQPTINKENMNITTQVMNEVALTLMFCNLMISRVDL